ncbi:hypothetical protein [Vulcanisaeta sp. JCM 16159]|uniref:hypothetical protein n=1 Tax=Vulcanisaeta sp. JCM 16159 TaxID=1295371 RepID=UPI000A486B27|nr:hypothetical protein [Vulcanisaeta sp. JCM 16159]
MAGLIRVVKEGNEEYVELTDLGKSFKSWYTSYPYPPAPWGPGWVGSTEGGMAEGVGGIGGNINIIH